ncbi:MAG: prolyl oligopeptidase family serine peptidase [Steroidobacteraceae bacterium]
MRLRTRFRRAVPEHSIAAQRGLFSTLLLAGLLLAAIMIGPTVAAAAPAAPPSAEVLGALPAATDVMMTPNGQRLAWVDQRFAKPRVVMFDIAARKELRILALPEKLKLRRIFWNDDETLIIMFSETQSAELATRRSREYFIDIAYDASGGEGRLLPLTKGNNNDARAAARAWIVRARPNKPHTLIMATQTCHNEIGCLIEVDTNTGQQTVIKSGGEFSFNWMVNRDGLPLAREDWDWKKRAYRLYALSGEDAHEILRTDDGEPPEVEGLLPDSSALVLLRANGQGHQAAWELPLDGSPMRLLAEEPDADITGVYTESYTGAVIGVFVGGPKPHVQWLDSQARQRGEILDRAFPNKTVNIYGWSTDGSRTLAEVQSGSSPPTHYLIDFSTHRADIAAESYPALENVPLGEFKEITYKARDGTPIPAYLTLPPGKPAGPVPLVVYPHGGPQARDYPGFDWVVQFLATRGYAVLQPQFRGSTGFGQAFEKAGYRQWGGLMQDDITDGVQAMIAQGVADPHHIAIVGMSYGGFAALAGAAFTPTLYSCAVSVNGVSDLHALRDESVQTSSINGMGVVRYISTSDSQFTERVGAETDPALKTRSPINSVEAIRIPVLVAYSTADGVVPNEQSERMAGALGKAGKPVTVVKLPEEDHWMSRSETRVQFLHALESFLHDHI